MQKPLQRIIGIAAELAPKHDEKDGEEVKPDPQQQQPGKVIEAPPSSQSQTADDKKSMVAEPIIKYSSIAAPFVAASMINVNYLKTGFKF